MEGLHEGRAREVDLPSRLEHAMELTGDVPRPVEDVLEHRLADDGVEGAIASTGAGA